MVSSRQERTPEQASPAENRPQAESRERIGWGIGNVFASIVNRFTGNRTPEISKQADVIPPMSLAEKNDPENPITGQDILEWAHSKGYGEELGVERAGILIEQGEHADYVFVVHDGGTVDIEFCSGGSCYPLSTLSQNDSIVGEIAALSDGVSTARVLVRKPTKIFAIPREQFKEIMQDPILGKRAEALANQRLMNTAAFHDRVSSYLEEKDIERMGGIGNEAAAHALDLKDVESELQSTQQSSLTRTFQLTGINPTTREVRTQEFDATYERNSGGDYSIVVTNKVSKGKIPVSIVKNGTQASTGSVQLQADAGFGFYSRIMRYLLRTVTYISATIVESNTIDFLTSHDEDDVSHSELAAHSPVVAARKGFISDMPTNMRSHVPLWSYRVDHDMEMILLIAVDIERSILNDDEKNLQRLYGMNRAEALHSLIGLMEDYVANEEYQHIDTDAKMLIERQYKRLLKLAENYPYQA